MKIDSDDRQGDRYVVLGHLQRGGTPTSYDREACHATGGKAVECLISQEVREDGGAPAA